MHPWLLNYPPVAAYGVCILLAAVVGWILARALARRRGVDVSLIDLLVPILMAAGLSGAWVFGWWTDALTDEAAHSAVLLGALVGGTMAGILFAVVQRIRLGVLGDIFAASVAVVIAGGRVGCFCAGCCYGKIAPVGGGGVLGFLARVWSVHFPVGSFAYVDQMRAGLIDGGASESLAVWPVQLWESAGCLVLAVVLWRIFERIRLGRGVSGEAFLALGIGYAGLRFFLEFARADNPAVWGGLTFSQVGAVVIAVAAGVTWWVRRRVYGGTGMQGFCTVGAVVDSAR